MTVATPVGATSGPAALAGTTVAELRSVRLVDETVVDLRIAVDPMVGEARIAEVVASRPGTAPAWGSAPAAARDAAQGTVLDATGWRFVPGASEPHAHLDKALTHSRTDPDAGNDLLTAIAQWRSLVPDIDRADLSRRARAAVERYVVSGITTIRTHVDALRDTDPLRGVESLVDLRESLRGVVTLQVCLLAGQDVPDPVLEDAVALGIDVVGGCPHLSDDPAGETRRMLDLAERHGLPVDLHTDERTDPARVDLADLAEQVIARGLQERVTASHCVRLGVLDAARLAPVLDVTARAGIGIVTLPITNLYLQGRGLDGRAPTPMPRGLPHLRAILEAGIPLAAGADNLRDPFNPVGRADPFETTSLLVTAGHLTSREALAAVTTGARTVLGLPAVGAQPGCAADFMLVPDVPLGDVLAGSETARVVVHGGRVVADTRVSRSVDLTATSLPRPISSPHSSALSSAVPVR